MAKYQEIAQAIRRMAREKGPGAALPSDRALGRRYGVSCGVIRMANELLLREGIIQRRHGQGTFVAERGGGIKPKRRLGLLYVDGVEHRSFYSQRLTLAVQECAQELGYELLIEQMRTADLLGGRIPTMIARRSVDGVVLDGRITPAHAAFLEERHFVYVATGVRPLGMEVPQVRPNMYRLGRELTRELMRGGRDPIWLEASPKQSDGYMVDAELIRGYMDELRQGGRSDMRLCSMNVDQTAAVVGQLLESDLANAAVIVQGWTWPMVAETLIGRTPEARGTLFVPLAVGARPDIQPRCRYVRWRQFMHADWIARPAVRGLVDVLEGRAEAFESVSLDPACRLQMEREPVEGEFTYAENRVGPRFFLEQTDEGVRWRTEEGQAGPIRERSLS